MILERSDILPCQSPVSTEGELEVSNWSPFTYLWLVDSVHIIFFSNEISFVKIFHFSGCIIATKQVLVLVFVSPLCSPNVYYLEISVYAIHQGSFFPSKQQRARVFRICADWHSHIFCICFVCTESIFFIAQFIENDVSCLPAVWNQPLG